MTWFVYLQLDENYLHDRTASDLEELGFIDKRQKGLIKDLIISGDKQVQDILDRYASGEREKVLGKFFETSTNKKPLFLYYFPILPYSLILIR